jgi:hypothetical protein
MDPDVNLREQLQLCRHLLDLEPEELDPDDVQRLCELVESLDDWILRGGFLPKRWKKH